MKFKITNEQIEICKNLGAGKNVKVNAVAGSGKTTTILELAKMYPNKKILSLTYNTKLNNETRDKIAEYGVVNLKSYTYHSFASRLNESQINNDILLDQALKDPSTMIKNWALEDFDIICLDEVQDLNERLFRLTSILAQDVDITWLVVGDYRQNIYGYNGADVRFFKDFDILIKRDFINLKLSKSFRITSNMAYFINHYLYKDNYINSYKTEQDSSSIIYYQYDPFGEVHKIVEMIQDFISQGYEYSDIFIVKPSLKKSKNSPLYRLENALADANIPIFFSSDTESILNEDEIKNKLVFTTIHQAKGRERKIVLFFDLDCDTFKYNWRSYDPESCPNELYVALTRAKEKLVIFQRHSSYGKRSERSDIASLLDWDHLLCDEKIQKRVIEPREFADRFKGDFTKKFKLANETPTNLVKHLKITEELNDKIKSLVISDKLVDNKGVLAIPNDIKIERYDSDNDRNYTITENVSVLNSAYLSYYYFKDTKNYTFNRLFKLAKKYLYSDDVSKFILESLPEYKRKIELEPNQLHANIMKLIYIETCYTQLLNTLNQITRFDWLDEFKDYDIVINRFKTIINNEKPVILEQEMAFDTILNENANDFVKDFLNEYPRFIKDEVSIKGRIDLINNGNIFELKCVNDLTINHYLQSIIYLFIYNQTNLKEIKVDGLYSNLTNHPYDIPEFDKIVLFNIKDGRKVEIENNPTIINDIMRYIFKEKGVKGDGIEIDDVEFIKKFAVHIKGFDHLFEPEDYEDEYEDEYLDEDENSQWSIDHDDFT